METEGIALRTANPSDRIALRGVRVRSRLTGMSQRTTVEQTFVNLEPGAIEAVYTFPLPEGAAVCGFEVVTGDRLLTGMIEEAEKAIEKYDEAIDQGHGAFVVEQERPDVFTVRVGNIKPRQAATIRLTYVAALERADKSIRVAFPTTVAPRFVTATGTDPLEAMFDGEALNPPHLLHVPYGVSLEVEVDLGRSLQGVYSPSHSVRSVAQRAATVREPSDGAAGPVADARGSFVHVVTLAGGVTEMNRDVVLSIDLAKETEPSVEVERGGNGESYLAVTFVPEFDVDELTDPAPSETFFVIDCSGSMQGESIRQATAALELCLRSLSTGDTFNVCRFGSSFELMSSEPLVYSQKTLDRAVLYVRQSSDLGGTELFGPLEAIFKTPPTTGKVRQVILLTDGQVSNEPACIQLARKHRNRNRVFTFGIGSACSAHLVKGLARATGGAAEFITEGERIEDKVLRTFGRLTSPQVTDVSIDWDGADVQTLAELPPVFDGDVLSVFGRAAGNAPSRVTLSCQTSAGPRKWTIAVPSCADATAQQGTIATMWARRMIQSLEEVNDLSRSHGASPSESRERQLLINLSKEFSLLCSLTTFISIEHRSLADRNEGRPALRRVPVALAKGWGGIDTMMARGGGMVMAAPAFAVGTGLLDLSRDADDAALQAAPRAAYSPAPPARSGIIGRLKKALGGNGNPASAPPAQSEAMFSVRRERPDAVAPTAGPADDLQLLLSRQQADGSFRWDADLRRLIDRLGASGWKDVVASQLASFASGVNGGVIVETLIVLLLLKTRFADQESLWRRAARKAVREALVPALGKLPGDVEEWIATELTPALASV